jgi:hypothetical protein
LALKPTAYDLVVAYAPYYTNPKPCGVSYATNQCAVRLSLAIEHCCPGFLNAFAPAQRVHRGRGACSSLDQHVLGAEELGQYLTAQWGAPGAVSAGRASLNGKFGVVWFKKSYVTASGSRSDHIDFWDGQNYMNEKLRLGAGGSAGPGTNLFSTSAGGIAFFPLL